MPPPDFGAFLQRSLALLAREAPAAEHRLAHALGANVVTFRVDGAPVAVRVEEGRPRVAGAREPGHTEVATDPHTILDLVDAKLTLLEALTSERFRLRGSLDAVTGFDAALLAYLDGAVRCPSFPALLDEFRRACRTPHLAKETA